MLKCYASGGRGKSATKTTSTGRVRNAVQSSPTRGRSGLSNARMNHYRQLWNSDRIGVRTMISSMQSEGASNAQIKQAIRWK